jgi:ABC-type methionine transport system permease subunit
MSLTLYEVAVVGGLVLGGLGKVALQYGWRRLRTSQPQHRRRRWSLR